MNAKALLDASLAEEKATLDRANAKRSEFIPLAQEAVDVAVGLPAGWQYPLPGPLAVTSSAPVWMDEHSDIYVGRSHVLLDSIIAEFKAGASPEDIASGYDTLRLADVYEAISYYLRYRDDVDAYLSRREAEAEALRRKIEATQPSKAALKTQIKEHWSRRSANASPDE